MHHLISQIKRFVRHVKCRHPHQYIISTTPDHKTLILRCPDCDTYRTVHLFKR